MKKIGFNKDMNLLKSKTHKKCFHFKPFKNLFKNKEGQSAIIEYATVIVCIVLALIAIQGYIKRGIQGGLRQSADSIGAQYDPNNTESDFNIASRSSITTISTVEITEAQVEGEKDIINSTTVVTTNYDEQTRSGTETVGAF